jgi:cytochrome P450
VEDSPASLEEIYAGQRTAPGPVNPPVNPIVPEIDLTSYDVYAHGVPDAEIDRLCASGPVFWHAETQPNEPGFWVLTRHQDIQDVGKNPTLFSSEKGAGALISIEESTVRRMTRWSLSLRRANMVLMDPPDHRLYRSLVMPFLSGPGARRIEPLVRDRVERLLETIPVNQPFDLVSRFSAVTPGFAMCYLLGVPEEDQEYVCALGDELSAIGDPNAGSVLEQAQIKTFQYGARLLEAKKANPGNDLLSAAYAASLNAASGLRPLSIESLFSLMIVAGHRTTRNTVTSGLLELYRHPDQVEMLRRDPDLIVNAVEEILRWTAVVPLFRRTATADTEIAGQKIAAGEKVVMWYTAGNRDESVFPQPHRFDITRAEAKKNLAFGFGAHMCAGNQIARVQLRAIIQAFVNRFERLEVLGEPEYLRTNQAISIKRVEVRVS